jgi:hypothetical protein
VLDFSGQGPSSTTPQQCSSREALGNRNGRDQHNNTTAGTASVTKEQTPWQHDAAKPASGSAKQQHQQHNRRGGRHDNSSEKEQQQPLQQGGIERGRPAERHRGWGPGHRSPLGGSPQGHRKQRRLSAGAKQVRGQYRLGSSPGLPLHIQTIRNIHKVIT